MRLFLNLVTHDLLQIHRYRYKNVTYDQSIFKILIQIRNYTFSFDVKYDKSIKKNATTSRKNKIHENDLGLRRRESVVLL